MLFNPLDNRYLYNIYDFNMRLLQPYSDYFDNLAKRLRRISDNIDLPVKVPYMSDEGQDVLRNMLEASSGHFRRMSGYSYIFHIITSVYDKPKFDINEVKIQDEYYDVQEELINKKSFCNLIRFKKVNAEHLNLPKLLVVAPMSGHYATLLRDTVKNLLPLYDVYITDWKNARDVPLIEGSFDLDDFIDYIISYLNLLAPNLNVMAVCQPTVPVLAAVALMSTNNSPNVPRTAILLGGPIDTSQSPTSVNVLASSRGDDWFQQNVISIVPSRFPGAMRLVYPGFMQLAGFMSMNFQRHAESLQKAVDRYADNQKEAAFKIIKFYLEYFSTMDLTAEFYMQTINTVFQEKLLTTGRYKSRGHNVRLQDIKHTSILAIEGEKDDITGVGQTKSVLGLCKNLPDTMKKYFLAEGVGHYGLFNGKKFRNIIIPEIYSFTETDTNS
ncbi:poly(3-hydroxybutyrate) depolymerase [Legionella steigerwaltii]|uniref:Poly(3-hydroxybutyrate) depolymerase n=1 Tax=Legionella steigerwaltii TaxID=460 RepID=A0A378L6M4_9GAMM|nr:polyhydroxyalkanoate depolymerase [Legionella steigerwaltii]KTD80302.1 poly(3-hydroxybutyrate) depolymerase [Legionella steigerwaltii]STY22384.1 poly(3-hydroxybutyrate) depolymerase [Legionella steigerwaltii]